MPSCTESLEAELRQIRRLLVEVEEDNPGAGAIQQAEWRGRVTAVMEHLAQGQQTLEKKVDDLMWKVAGVSAAVSLLVALVLQLIK